MVESLAQRYRRFQILASILMTPPLKPIALDHAHAQEVLDAEGMHVAPGFIDLHSHPGRVETTVHAVSTHQNMLAHGVTTTLSQGDAGADTLADYLDKTHEPSGTRVFMALNLQEITIAKPFFVPGG